MHHNSRNVTNTVLNKKDKISYELFALFINTVMLVDIVRLMIGNSLVVTAFRNILYIVCFAYMLYHAFTRKHVTLPALVFVVYLFLILLSLLAYAELNDVILNSSRIFISRCLPGLYFAYYLRDYDQLYESIKKYYIPLLLYCYLFATHSVNEVIFGTYMTFSYNVLILTMLAIINCFEKFSIVSLIIAITALVSIIAFGARGPLLCILISSLIYGKYKMSNISIKKQFAALSGIVMIGIVVINAKDRILEYLISINPSSRTLRLLNNAELFDTSGRDTIYDYIVGKINENFIIPHGLYADRKILADQFGTVDYSNYPHQFVLEIIYQFGGIIGIIILVALFVKVLQSIRCLSVIKNNMLAAWYCAFLTGFTCLFVSSSYLVNERAWLYFGIVFSVIKMRRLISSMSISDPQGALIYDNKVTKVANNV